MRLFADRVASLIRSRREDMGLTQKQLAKKLGWVNSQSMAVSNIENCRNQLPVKKIPLVAEVLNLDKGELLEAMAQDYKASLIDFLDEKKQAQRKKVETRKRELLNELKKLQARAK